VSDLVDGLGVPFSQVRKMIGPRKDWGPSHRVELDGLYRHMLFGEFHIDHEFCWLCGVRPNGFDWDTIKEAHHFTGPNRSDEVKCLAMTCRKCHRERAGTKWFARWLWAKWKHDHANCSWIRITVVRGSWLPTPEAPVNGAEFFEPHAAERRRA